MYDDEGLLFTPQVRFELHRISELISDQAYQRALSQKHVEETAGHFDLCQINPIKVSFRNNKYYVLNGQHTMEAIALASGSRETKVWCMVYDDLEYEREADIFANQMKYTKALRPLEVFKAKLEAGEGEALSIQALVDSYNLTLDEKPRDCTIGAVASLEEIYRKYGYHILDRTLYLIVNAWEGECRSFTANILKAVARLISTYEEELKDETFIDKLGCVSVNEICRSASERRAGSLGFAETILTYYNRKCTNPLHNTKLYRR